MTTVLDEISIADFAHSLDVSGRRLPWDGTIEPTFRCNLNCVHCYVNKPAGDAAEVRAASCRTERVKTLIDEVADAGCLSLLLTGGEVLIRQRLPARSTCTRSRRGLRVSIFTNAPWSRTRSPTSSPPPSRRHRDHALRDDAETYDRVTRVPARSRAAWRASSASIAAASEPQAQDHGALLERPRDPGHARVRRATARLPARQHPEPRASTAGPAATASCR